MKTKVNFIRKNATFRKAHESDSGFDLTACDYKYKGNGLWHILLGVEVEPPKGFYFEVVPRSSFSKTPFVFANDLGIIDQSYRGEICFPTRHINYGFWEDNNTSDSLIMKDKTNIESDIKKWLSGKRIAQALLRPYITSQIEITNKLTETERGKNGFGSSGE